MDRDLDLAEIRNLDQEQDLAEIRDLDRELDLAKIRNLDRKLEFGPGQMETGAKFSQGGPGGARQSQTESAQQKFISHGLKDSGILGIRNKVIGRQDEYALGNISKMAQPRLDILCDIGPLRKSGLPGCVQQQLATSMSSRTRSAGMPLRGFTERGQP